MKGIPLLDLARQEKSLRVDLEQAAQRVLRSGRYILGPELKKFEQEFARFCRTRFAVGVASGTDALELSLRALGVGPGHLVATVSFTFLATVDAILHVGAEPLFIDIDPDTYTMDPRDLEKRLKRLSASDRRRLKAVIPVHLYGHPCDMTAIGVIARRYKLSIIEDAAQAAGARWNGRPVGGFGDCGAFSFFPTKNLASFGDAGAIVTHSPALAEKLRKLRVHGRDDQGRQALLGRNSRLDEMQAAFLRIKLKNLNRWISRRRTIAAAYNRRLMWDQGISPPIQKPKATHSYGLYTIRARNREGIKQKLKKQGIDSAIYYSVPVHRQPLHLKQFSKIRLPQTEQACRQVLSLPIFPELTHEEVGRVSDVLAS